MSDLLKLSDPQGDSDTARIASAIELDEEKKRIRQLEANIAALKKALAEKTRTSAHPVSDSGNKIGARKHASFKAISTAPSINKTPIGPTMVPIPYPTVQDLSNSVNTAKTVNFNGCPAYLLDATTQPHCTGDEPGTGKGVKSGTVSGEVKPVKGSSTVRIEGKQVLRDGDPCTMNGGNNPGVYVTTCTPSTAPPKTAASTSNPPIKLESGEEQSAFKNWLNHVKDAISQAVAQPFEGLKGATKGIANIPSNMLELISKAANEQHASNLSEQAVLASAFGQKNTAKLLSEVSADTSKQGQNIDIPKFKMQNPAQEGGDIIATAIQIFAGGAGIAKGTAKAVTTIGKASITTSAASIDTTEVIAKTANIPLIKSIPTPSIGDGVRIIGKVKGENVSNYNIIVNSIDGKINFEADALTPGSLGDDYKDVPGTFSGGRYTTIQLDKPLKVYRAWAQGQSKEFGAFWSLDMPLGGLQSRIDSALLPEWGTVRGTVFRSQATQYTIIELPVGTTIHVGEVGSQGSVWVGGKSQLLIEGGAQPAWKIGGGKLQ